uniref:Tyrosine decarboxylase n=1 Tax=Calcidiscus leptoporus TaxID=127549 RepID=A0A7S0NU21_9EUKA|mmetsp:Transcript_23117/g.53453  ORF Transcript_23117/g.53453 Transcript_23117/m.53453 type:complete len:161 (+) Transcript_23117:75-557(+)
MALDPSNWPALRANAHALLDASLDKLEAASEGRVWTPVPDALKEELRSPLPPEHGLAHDELREKLQALLPYGVGNTHPRFFGWVHGSGSPGGMLPELVGAAMNSNCGGRDHVAIYVERQVVMWCKAMMGFPADAGGLLVTGTSMATILALKAGRDGPPGF